MMLLHQNKIFFRNSFWFHLLLSYIQWIKWFYTVFTSNIDPPYLQLLWFYDKNSVCTMFFQCLYMKNYFFKNLIVIFGFVVKFHVGHCQRDIVFIPGLELHYSIEDKKRKSNFGWENLSKFMKSLREVIYMKKISKQYIN